MDCALLASAALALLMVERARMASARRIRVAIVMVASASASTARAEPGDEDVVVRGSQAAGFVSRAKVGEGPREVTDAASLVEPLPGVHVRRLGADDSFATLSIRGSSSTEVAVYLAGVPLSGGADPTLDLATLPLWPGAGARVHRSFAPAALGRGSLGGTLVIDPPSARAAPGTELWTAVGSYGSRRLRIGDVSDLGGVRVATGISASRSDDDFSYLDPADTLAAGHDVFRSRVNAGHSAVAGLASVAIPLRLGGASGSETGALTATTLAQAREQELPGPARALTPRQRLDSTRLLSALELTLPTRGGAFGVRAWGRREGLAIHDDPRSVSPGSAWSTDDGIVAAGGSTGWRGRLGEDTTLEVRLDGSEEGYAPGTWLGATTPPSARRTNAGVALDATTRAGLARLAASGRGDAWFDASDDGPSTKEGRPTGNVGIELPLAPVPVTLASHAGFVARPPSFVERYGNRGAFIGDPGLKSESAFTTDAGARTGARLGPVNLRAEVVGFATWASDLITYVYTGAYGRAKATNIGEARLLGLEGELGATAFGFDARASHTALATANLSVCSVTVAGICDRPPLPGRPEQDFVGDLSFTRGPVRLRYGVDAVAGIFTDQTGTLKVPARVLHGASVSLVVPGLRVPTVTVTLDVRNLFDLRVVEYAGAVGPVREPIGDLYDYPLPGRRILLSARLSFAR
jgi:hypothetical protein